MATHYGNSRFHFLPSGTHRVFRRIQSKNSSIVHGKIAWPRYFAHGDMGTTDFGHGWQALKIFATWVYLKIVHLKIPSFITREIDILSAFPHFQAQPYGVPYLHPYAQHVCCLRQQFQERIKQFTGLENLQKTGIVLLSDIQCHHHRILPAISL